MSPKTTSPFPVHPRYPYRPLRGRPQFAWPDGKRLAVFIAINVEHIALQDGSGLPVNPAQPVPDVPNYCWRDYGNRIGVWRLIDLLDQFEFPGTFLINTAVYDFAPAIPEAIFARGDELVAHGRSNAERQGALPEVDEAALIRETTELLLEANGVRPTGWMSPWLSESAQTPDLLAEAGYRYVLDWAPDDQPIWLRCRAGRRLLAIPYARPSNDLPMLFGNRHTPAQYTDLLVDQFDEMLEQSQDIPLVFNLSLHPYFVGQPFRLRQLRRFFNHLAAHRAKLWLCHPGEIAAYCESLPDNTLG